MRNITLTAIACAALIYPSAQAHAQAADAPPDAASDADTATPRMTPPRLVQAVEPVYPEAQRKDGRAATVGLVLTLDAEGRLVACDHGNRRVYRLENDGKTKTTLADKYEGKRLNSPNDLVYKSNGDLYFTDPPYGLMPEGSDATPGRELDFQGVYRLAKDGKLTLLTKEMSRPNGLAFAPDEKTLYVANSDPQKAVWMAFPVKSDGTLGAGKVFCELLQAKEGGNAGGDGLTVDSKGNVYITSALGLQVFDPTGKHLGTIKFPEQPSNVTFGGKDMKTLYVTARTSVYTCPMEVAGHRFPGGK